MLPPATHAFMSQSGIPVFEDSSRYPFFLSRSRLRRPDLFGLRLMPEPCDVRTGSACPDHERQWARHCVGCQYKRGRKVLFRALGSVLSSSGGCFCFTDAVEAFSFLHFMGGRRASDVCVFFPHYSYPCSLQDIRKAGCMVSARHATAVGWYEAAPFEDIVGNRMPECIAKAPCVACHLRRGGAGEPKSFAGRANGGHSERGGNSRQDRTSQWPC
jgi:hypothetical protein